MLFARAAAGRSVRVTAGLCLALTLGGCVAARANPSWRVPTAPATGSKELVFYATDREPVKLEGKCRAGETPTTQPMYGTSAGGELIYGEFPVQLPPLASYSELVAYHPRPECLRPDLDPLFLAGPTQQERPQFLAALHQAAGNSPGKRVLVFVHG